MKLYYHPLSTYSQKVLMACHEKKVEPEPQIVDLMNEKGREEYLKVYPLGKIPLLVRDDGWVIPESSIIVEFLDGHSDAGPRLIPEESERARQTRCMDRMSDLYLNDSVATLLFQSWKPEAERDAEAIERSKFRAGVMYEYLDGQLADREWIMGEDLTMADCAAAAPLFYAQQVLPFSDRSNLSAYWERLQARPSYQQVLAEARPHLEKLRASD